MKIEILGGGCASCRRLKENVRKAVDVTGMKAEIIAVEDMAGIMKYRVMMTPALVINGRVMVTGSVPTTGQIIAMLEKER